MKISRISAAIVSLLALPAVVLAQTITSFQSLANSLATILNDGALLLIAAALVVYFYSIASNVFKIGRGETTGPAFRRSLWWGLAIIFLMVSIWGLIQFLQYSLFGGPSPSAGSNGVIIYGN